MPLNSFRLERPNEARLVGVRIRPVENDHIQSLVKPTLIRPTKSLFGRVGVLVIPDDQHVHVAPTSIRLDPRSKAVDLSPWW